MVRRGDADHLALGRRERDHHEIVLIGSIGRLAFGTEDADDAQRNAFDLDHRPERIDVCAEQLPVNRLAKHDDQRGLVSSSREMPWPMTIFQLVAGG